MNDDFGFIRAEIEPFRIDEADLLSFRANPGSKSLYVRTVSQSEI